MSNFTLKMRQLKIPNNFFRTLFSLTVIIQLLEWYRKKRKFWKKIYFVFIMAIWKYRTYCFIAIHI